MWTQLLTESAVPFEDYQEAEDKTKTLTVKNTQAEALHRVLQLFCRSGGNGRPPKTDYVRPNDIALALNQFNARDNESWRRPWAYFHEDVLDFSAGLRPANFRWNKMALWFMPENDEDEDISHDNFKYDIQNPWPSIAQHGAARRNRSQIRYRLLCFIHRHQDRVDRRNFYKNTYSMSVYDREVRCAYIPLFLLLTLSRVTGRETPALR